MPEEALQAAFEIKTACDEISRRLLRWHWEHKPGAHSLGALLDHVAQRQQESPDYYDRMPDLSGKNSWQQLDTTICMRVLLDPEKDAAKPLDLLGNTRHPGAARRACNAVRTARNEAAHATDHTDAAQAAILFNEAVESLEDGYVGTAFRENELARYYRDAENYLARCGAKEPIVSSRAPEEKTAAHEPARQSTKQGQNRSTQSRKTAGSRSSGSRSTTARSSSAKSRSTAGRKKKQRRTGNKTVFIVLLVVLLLGLAALLTLISFALINNTIRLAIYSKRFLIHTMKLVGASWGFIRKPFLVRNIWIGVLAAVMADAALIGMAYALVRYEPELIEIITPMTMLLVMSSVFVFGVIITFMCAYISINKYLRMKAGALYYI